MTVALGIDFGGERSVGAWAVVEVMGRQRRLLDQGLLRQLTQRQFRDTVAAAIERYRPDVIGTEQPFEGGRGPGVGVKHGERLGVVKALAEDAGIKPMHFPPAVWKKARTGNGRASKEQVIANVHDQFPDFDFRAEGRNAEHLADAMAIALTAALHYEDERILEKARAQP